MFEQDSDDNRKFALWLVFGVVTLVVASVLSFAIARTLGAGSSAPAVAGEALGEPVLRLYFELGQVELSADAQGQVAQVGDQVRVSGALVVISGFHDASGNAATNAAIARRRAESVQHALEASGVSPDRLVLRKPAQTLGGGDPKEARRVELHLQ